MQPTSPETTRAAFAKSFYESAETFFQDSQARTLEPSYFMQAADVYHTDPTKRLVATHDAASHTSFLIESYPIEGSTDDRYDLIRWENTDSAETEIPHGWIRVAHEKGKEPRIALATSVGSVHQALLPGGEYAEGWVTANEATELTPEALQDVLSRLNRSTVDTDLTEKMWRYAEQDRLRWHVANARYLAATASNSSNQKQYNSAVAYRDAAERQYQEFNAKYHFPIEERPEPTQAQINDAVATYRTLVKNHPEIIEYARKRDEAALEKWIRLTAGNTIRRSEQASSSIRDKEEEEKTKKAEQAAIEANQEELAEATSTSS